MSSCCNGGPRKKRVKEWGTEGNKCNKSTILKLVLALCIVIIGFIIFK